MLYFGHCVVCPSLIYSFRLPIWYLQTLLSMTDNTMAKIKHATLIEEFEDTKWIIWSCKSKDRKHNGQNKACHIDRRVWRYQMGNLKLYPFGIFKLLYQCGMLYFGHCVVCPSLIYSFRLPLWYLQTLLSMCHFLFWPFEDTKWVIWSCKSKKDRQHDGQNKTCQIDRRVWRYQMGNLKL
jgi:hypothetical protein